MQLCLSCIHPHIFSGAQWLRLGCLCSFQMPPDTINQSLNQPTDWPTSQSLTQPSNQLTNAELIKAIEQCCPFSTAVCFGLEQQMLSWPNQQRYAALSAVLCNSPQEMKRACRLPLLVLTSRDVQVVKPCMQSWILHCYTVQSAAQTGPCLGHQAAKKQKNSQHWQQGFICLSKRSDFFH